MTEEGKTASQVAVMIAGNPPRGRRMCACALVLVVLIALSLYFIAMRKKTAPLKESPLVPSTLIFIFATR